MKIPTEDFTDETLAIDYTQGDDVSGGDWCAGHGGWQGGRWGGRHHVGDMVANMEVDNVADMLVMIPDEDYWCDWELVILMEMILDVVMNMEVDKVANIMVNMEVDKVANMEINWQVDWHGGKGN